MSIKSFRRYECKFLITKSQMDQLLEKLQDLVYKDPYCEKKSSYCIANIFYDTPNKDIIRQATSKPKFKEKFRIRCYEEDVKKTSPVFVEIKRKMNQVVTKRRIALSLEELDPFLNGQMVTNKNEYLDLQIAKELQYFIKTHDLKPSYYLRYDRIAYYLKEQPSIRITFDFNVIVRDYFLNFTDSTSGKKLLPDDIYILEIKNNGAIPLWLCHILSEIKIYKTSFSKVGRYYQNNSKELIQYVQKFNGE